MENQIEEKNTMIAEFMGLSTSQTDVYLCPELEEAELIGLGVYVHLDELLYDKSWSWLMTVVNRIDNLDTLSSVAEPYLYSFDMVNQGHVTVFDSFNATTVVSVPNDGRYCREAVYQACIKFINFYNQSKTK
tara:strand:- start:1914 stop:2309 length:396 start_codon:yes stop_codon:yes gene_type:complete